MTTSPVSVSQSSSPVKTALIAEGGGQRGIFTAGVLDSWLEAEYDPFDILIGTSAGSQNLTSFMSRQKGYAQRLIRGLTRHKSFFRLGRGLMGKHIVDLDWYFDKTQEANRLIDFDTAQQNARGRELLFTATNANNRKPYFFNPLKSKNRWVDLIKASSALPFLYKRGVPLETRQQHSDTAATIDFYLDGGLAAPLPVTEAYRRGAKKIVVIRTVDRNFQVQPAWLNKLTGFMCIAGHCPKTVDYLLQHDKAYADELAFIQNPPEDVEIVQIFASEKLQSKLLGSTSEELRQDYKAGRKAGYAFLAQQGQSLQMMPDAEPVSSAEDISELPDTISATQKGTGQKASMCA